MLGKPRNSFITWGKKRLDSFRNLRISEDPGGVVAHIPFTDEQFVANAESDENCNQKLYDACIQGDTATIKSILQHTMGDFVINCADSAGYTPLHKAARHGHVGVIDLLVRRNQKNDDESAYFYDDAVCAIDAKTHEGLTPLHLTIIHNKMAAMKALLDIGADPATADNKGYTAIHYAARGPTSEALSLLLGPLIATNPKPSKSRRLTQVFSVGSGNNSANTSPVPTLQRSNSVLSPAGLVKSSSAYNLRLQNMLFCRANNGYTPLHCAVSSNNEECVKVLLSAVAGDATNYVCMASANSSNCLHLAAEKGYADIFNMLIAAVPPVALWAPNEDGQVCLHTACANGHTNIAAVLLSNLSSNFKELTLRWHDKLLMSDNKLNTPLHFAAMNNCAGCVALIYSTKCLRNVGDEKEKLVSSTDDIIAPHIWDAPNDDGLYPIHIASMKGHTNSVEMMIIHHADIHVKTPSGDTPLYLALLGDHGLCADMLRENGAKNTEISQEKLVAVEEIDTTLEQMIYHILTATKYAARMDAFIMAHKKYATPLQVIQIMLRFASQPNAPNINEVRMRVALVLETWLRRYPKDLIDVTSYTGSPNSPTTPVFHTLNSTSPTTPIWGGMASTPPAHPVFPYFPNPILRSALTSSAGSDDTIDILIENMRQWDTTDVYDFAKLADEFVSLREEKGYELAKGVTYSAISYIGCSSYKEDEKTTFLTYDSKTIAQQLALIDFDLLRAIARDELFKVTGSGVNMDVVAPNLSSAIDFFNRISGWVKSTILKQDKLPKRTTILCYHIKLLKHCYQLQDFHASFAIASSLQSGVISRLARTWAQVPAKLYASFQTIANAFSLNHNYREYRELLAKIDLKQHVQQHTLIKQQQLLQQQQQQQQQLNGSNTLTHPSTQQVHLFFPCVPYIGMFYVDVVYLNDGNPDYVGVTPEYDKIINIAKFKTLASKLAKFQEFQKQPCATCEVNPDINLYLLHVKGMINDKEEWNYSNTIEVPKRHSIKLEGGIPIPPALPPSDEKHINLLLYEMCVSGNVEETSRLLKLDTVDIAYQNDKGNTLLHAAVENGNVALVQLLISISSLKFPATHVEPFNKVNNDGYSPLAIAVLYSNMSIVDMLLKEKFDKFTVDNQLQNLLHLAAKTNHLGILRALIDNGLHVELFSQNKQGYTPLHLATLHSPLDNVDCLSFLVRLGGTKLILTTHNNKACGTAAYHIAAEKGFTAAYLMFLSANTNAESPRNYDLAAIMSNSANDYTDEIMWQRNEHGQNSLHLACTNGSIKIVEVLMNALKEETIADISYDYKNNTPLHYAASNSPSCVEILYNNTKLTQLRTLPITNNTTTTETTTTTNNGSDNNPTTTTQTPQTLNTIEENNTENNTNNNTTTETTTLKTTPTEEELNTMLENFIIDHVWNTPNTEGEYPLHFACRAGNLECVKMLLDYGVDVRTRNIMNETPLYLVALGSHNQCIAPLLEKGASFDEMNAGKLLKFQGDLKIDSGTIDQLIDYVLSSPTYEAFWKNFLIVCKSIASGTHIMTLIYNRFIKEDPNNTDLHKRAFSLLEVWLKNYPSDFRESKRLTNVTIQFLTVAERFIYLKENIEICNNILQQQSAPVSRKQDSQRVTSISRITPAEIFVDDADLLLMYSPEAVAQQLTLINFDMFRIIRREELYVVDWENSEQRSRSPALAVFSDFQNGVIDWVRWLILKEEKISKRVKLITFFIKMLDHCITIQNFDAVGILYGALGGPVKRLKKTTVLLSDRVKEMKKRAKKLLSPDLNFKNYRDTITKVQPPAIPQISQLCKDIFFCNMRATLIEKDGVQLIDYKKLEILSNIIYGAQKFQGTSYDFEVQPKLNHYLKHARGKSGEKVQYEMSYLLQPRGT